MLLFRLQAKTFKGLLRESAIEVCEILNKNYDIDFLFGKAGNKDPGILSSLGGEA